MATNTHVSVLWMLMGGWNHQYAAASTISSTMTRMMIAFLLNFGTLAPSKGLWISGPEPPRPPPPPKPPKPGNPPNPPKPPRDPLREPPASESESPEAACWEPPDPAAPPPNEPSTFMPDCLSASSNASKPDDCFTSHS